MRVGLGVALVCFASTLVYCAGAEGGDTPRAEAIKANFDKLVSEDKEVKREALLYFGKVDKTFATEVPLFTVSLKDERNQVRAISAFALGKIGKAAAGSIPAVEKLLTDSSATVQKYARQALERLRPFKLDPKKPAVGEAAKAQSPSAPSISIHEAAEKGDLETIKKHVAAGTNINSTDWRDGETPLHRAITRGQTEAAKLLIEKGCNINIGRTKDGDTPLDMAEGRGRTEIAKLLREKEAKRSSKQRPSQFSKVEPRQMADAFEQALVERWAYYKANNANFGPSITKLRKSAQQLSSNQLGIELQKIIALGIDGHAGVKGYSLPGRYLPFLIMPSGNKYVAFKPDRSGFLSEGFPFITAIDGLPLSVWIKAAKTMVSKGSPQYVQNHCLRLLRSIEYLREQLGVKHSNTLQVELTSRDNSKKKIINLPLSNRRPLYGVFPNKPSSLIPENIGYLRLRSMDRNAVDEILRWMPKFRETKGMIVDVRSNGGGTREALRIFYSFLVAADSTPRVANCAKYRLHPDFDRDHLAARFMYEETDSKWTEAGRSAITKFKDKFKPQWNPPEKEFSKWHYLVLSRMDLPSVYHYDKPVVVLMNAKCFSATDIFLSGLKGIPNVFLLGKPSGGGSARSVTLQLGNFSVRLASMASFNPDGRLFDGNGIQPDIRVDPLPEYYIGGRDNMLEAAVELINQ